MLTPNAAQERAAQLIELARRGGADAADAVFSGNAAQSISIRLGKLEDVERSENEHVGLRVFVGKRSATVGTSDFSPQALAELAERAVAMARLAPEDPYAGLAPAELLTSEWDTAALDLADPTDLSPETLREMAHSVEDAARAVPGVTNSEGGGASASEAVFALVTSEGFAGAYATTSRGCSASVIAGTGADMQRDYAWRMARHAADLLAPEEIGQLAGTRAVARLQPERVKSGPMPVVFDPRVGGTLIGHLLGAIAGSSVARRSTFLLDKLGEQIFAPGIAIIDDSSRPRGMRSRPFDGEGLRPGFGNLIDDGRLTGWMVEAASARQLGLAPTGHAVRGTAGAPSVGPGNVHLAAGTVSPSALMSDIREGIYVTELIGQGVNGVTGDYSRGAGGFLIQNGEVTRPVSGITIAGNLLDMFAKMAPANDLEWFRAINVPTIRIDGMMLAGD